MRIAITGTHSSGKTTLAQKIAENYSLEYVRGDKAVDIMHSVFPGKSIDSLSVKEQWRLQQEMFESFDEALNVENSVTDGFHLTCIPYGDAFTDKQIRSIDGYNSFYQNVLARSKQFDAIVYVPPEIALEDDGFRPVDIALQRDIDTQIYSLLESFDFLTVNGPVDQRVRTVGDHLGLSNSMFQNFVALEGLPRAGKSTQTRLLSKQKNIHVVERTDNMYIREFNRWKQSDPYTCSDMQASLLSKAITEDIKQNAVLERLSNGQVVISDRHKYSVLSLFEALGVSRQELCSSTYDVLEPGRVLYLDISAQESVQRSRRTDLSVLKNDVELQENVRASYMRMACEKDFTFIDATKPVEEVYASIVKQLDCRA